MFDRVGWENFDRPQGEPPGPTERRRRRKERRRRGGERRRLCNIGYACLAFMNVCYYLRVPSYWLIADKTCKKACISHQCLCLPTSLKLLFQCACLYIISSSIDTNMMNLVAVCDIVCDILTKIFML